MYNYLDIRIVSVEILYILYQISNDTLKKEYWYMILLNSAKSTNLQGRTDCRASGTSSPPLASFICSKSNRTVEIEFVHNSRSSAGVASTSRSSLELAMWIHFLTWHILQCLHISLFFCLSGKQRKRYTTYHF